MRKASRHVQPYPPEFRTEAICLARTSGKSYRQIAEDLGMASETLRLWRQRCMNERSRPSRRVSLEAHGPRNQGHSNWYHATQPEHASYQISDRVNQPNDVSTWRLAPLVRHLRQPHEVASRHLEDQWHPLGAENGHARALL